MAQSKWKCRDCGGGGDSGNCMWCGGTGRPSYQQAHMKGLSSGQKGYKIQCETFVKRLLVILTNYGSASALNTAFPGVIEFTSEVTAAGNGSVAAVMAITHRMKSSFSREDLDAFFGESVYYIIEEISPNRYD